ncbi:MAG: tetratricopeptide repeat protein [Chlorobi bacterium]|nr:tetratricopeptide repeat protein [Chlorobiota bacterium]
MAQTYLKQGKIDRAEEILTEWEQNNGFRRPVFRDLLKIYIMKGEFDKAEQYILRTMKRYPYAGLDADLYHLYKAARRDEDARRQQKAILKKIQQRPHITLTLARRLREYGYSDFALQLLNGYEKIKPVAPLYLEKGYLYAETGRRDSMMNAFIKAVELHPGYLSLVEGRLYDYISPQPDNPYNRSLLNQLSLRIRQHPLPQHFRLLEWLYIRQKQYEKAFAAVRSLYRLNRANLHEILNLANDALEDGQTDAATMINEFVLKEAKPEDQNIRDRALLLKSRIEAALHRLPIREQTALWLERTRQIRHPKTRFELEKMIVDLLIREKNYDRALRLSDSLEKTAVRKAYRSHWKEKRGDIFLHQGLFDRAAILYTLLREETPYEETGYRLLYKIGLASFLGGDPGWAHRNLKPLKKASQRNIANDALWLDFLIISNKSPGDTLQKALKNLAKAYFAYYQQDFPALQRISDSLFALPENKKIRDDLLYLQGKLSFEQQEWDKSETFWQKLLDKTSEKMFREEALYRLGMIFEKRGDAEKAQYYFKQILTDYPEGFYFEPAQRHYRQLNGENSSI